MAGLTRREALAEDRKVGFFHEYVRDEDCLSEYCTYFGVFGERTNFCYSRHDDEKDAKEEADLMNKT